MLHDISQRFFSLRQDLFQWALTLGGECYLLEATGERYELRICGFNGHPPLGVNATNNGYSTHSHTQNSSFNGHPPLGVNATSDVPLVQFARLQDQFQWAPTLGGECYTPAKRPTTQETGSGFNGHPPLGVNATQTRTDESTISTASVSMGTHPWG